MERGLKFLLIGIVSLSFLYYFFSFTYGQQISFTRNTRIIYPIKAKDLRYEDTGPSFFGDGRREFSFILPSEQIESFRDKKPFGKEWQQGPYVNLRTETTEDNVTQLVGSQQIKNTESILYAVKDYSPDGHTGMDFFLLVFDPETGQVLFAKDNS